MDGIGRITTQSIKGLKLTAVPPAQTVALRKSLRKLWDVFTQHICAEVITRGKCTILASSKISPAQLFLEDGEGQKHGVISDPLKIAPRMAEKGLEGIKFSNTASAANIEKCLLAILSDGFEPVPGTSLYCLDDIFATGAEQGLPLLPGVAYQRSAASAGPRKAKKWNFDDFQAFVYKSSSAKDILNVLAANIVPHYAGGELAPFAQVLIAKARWFNEQKGALDSAVALWVATYKLPVATNLIQIMMDVANQCSNLDLPKDKRKIDSAVKVWKALYGLDFHDKAKPDDEKTRIIKTIMAVADKGSDPSLSREERDIESALKLWRAAFDLSNADNQDRIIKTMMEVANRLADHTLPAAQRDIDSAIAIWKTVHALRKEPENQIVILTMMDVANKLSDISAEKEKRDVASACKIWPAVYALRQKIEDERQRVILTMMAAANRFTDLALPKEKRDPASACLIWKTVYGLEKNQRVILTMMDVANSLSNLSLPCAQRDFDSACIIWEAVHSLTEGEQREITFLTVMDVANKCSDTSKPKGQRDIGAAISLWKTAYGLRDQDGKRRIVLTMMAVANKLADHTAAREQRDIDSACLIWAAVHGLRDDEQKGITIRTMMDVANKLVRISKDTQSAVRIWPRAYRLTSPNDQSIVVSTILDIASTTADFCQEALPLFEKDSSLDSYFYERVLAGLHYYSGNFQRVIDFVDSRASQEPEVIAQKADALRKLKTYPESIRIASGVITRYLSRTPLSQRETEGLMSALCCRGYCYYERGKITPGGLSDAIADFNKAIEIARASRIPVKPRAYTGLGYIYQELGQQDQARQAFQRAREADEDNRKALSALISFDA